MMQLPSWAWTSLLIAAACIFLSLVATVENCDMAPLGRESMFVQHVQRERGHARGGQHTRWPSVLMFKTKAELKQIKHFQRLPQK